MVTTSQSDRMTNPAEPEPGPSDDPTAVSRLIRTARHLATVCLRSGWSLDGTRSFVMEQSGQAITEGDDLTVSFVRTVVNQGVDEAIIRNHNWIRQEARPDGR